MEKVVEKIEYQIIRKQIKNLYIRIKDGRVMISAPRSCKESDILQLLEKKKRWIQKAIEESKVRKKIEERKYTKEEIQRFQIKLNELLERYIKKMNLYPQKVRIRNIKYAWGSCSSKKNITFNAKLIDKDERFVEYVVVHELCHLKYMNHSKYFWKLVSEYIPNYKEYRTLGKENRNPSD